MTNIKTLQFVFEETKRAYGDLHDLPHRELGFAATYWVDRDTAHFIMRHCVPSYNDFRASIIKELPDNCLVRIAREGSVCLYVLHDFKRFENNIMKADECDTQVDHDLGCITRLWWD